MTGKLRAVPGVHPHQIGNAGAVRWLGVDDAAILRVMAPCSGCGRAAPRRRTTSRCDRLRGDLADSMSHAEQSRTW